MEVQASLLFPCFTTKEYFFLLLLILFNLQSTATSATVNSSTDMSSLLAFKAGVDASGILEANWTRSTSFCSWIGIGCNSQKQQQMRVISLNLSSLALQGSISSHLSNLSFLTSLDLSNNSLTGIIPESLGRLPGLVSLNLQSNLLSGPIPSSIFNMSSLVDIQFGSNRLSGPLLARDSLFEIARLQLFSVENNMLTGEIPPSFSRCSDLQHMYLDSNEFNGSIPPWLGNLSGMTMLNLNTNRFTGMIPASLGNLTKLRGISLTSNQLTGDIPAELGNLANLEELQLSNNSFTGSIPVSLLNCSMMTSIGIAANNFTGTVPAALGIYMPRLETLFMGSNRLTGDLDFVASLTNCKGLKKLELTGNQLDGIIPDAAGNFTANLRYFDFSGNNIKGNIPAALGNLSSLISLQLAFNELTGTIPPTLTGLKELQFLHLATNKLRGPIPSDIGLLTNLAVLALSVNELSGPIPDSLGNISRLQIFEASENKLTSIPLSLWSLRGLNKLNIYQNRFQGTLPPQMANLESVYYIDLWSNRLSGNIPSGIGQLQSITYLELSNNSFHGEIPQQMGNLVGVDHLNLSHNFLTGTIPKSLANLRYITTLDLSFNLLEGQIPQGRVFSNVSIPILMENSALCGAPQLGFQSCTANVTTSNSKNRVRLLKYVLPSVASVLVLITCIALFLRLFLRKKHKIPSDEESPCLNYHRRISYFELIRATDNFSEANVLGKGSFGTVYKGSLDDGFVVAVKVLNLEVEGASKSFDAECRTLGMVRHRNLVKIITTCSNLEFKALVLDFMPNESLDKWLYSESRSLTLLQRINIMVDVSMALDYLHHHHPQVIVHCDLKPGNILLDEDMVAHVSDFGIAKLVLGDSKTIVSGNGGGTIGYMAPEYGSTGGTTRRGDVYSFGILLLELFTGKKPVDAMFCGESNLRQWVCSAYPAAVLEIADCEILRDDSSNLLHPSGMTVLHRCLSSIFELGLNCSVDSPKERIQMKDVVPILENIKTEYCLK